MSGVLYLSHSKINTYETCPRMYYFQYVLKVKQVVEGCNLAFGSAVDVAIEGYLKAEFVGKTFDIVASFKQNWNGAVQKSPMHYSSRWDADKLRDTGTVLAQKWAKAWKDSGLRVLADSEGNPVVQRELTTDFGNDIHVRAKLDLIAVAPSGNVIVADVKTCAAITPEDYADYADQLTAYQIHGDAHNADLGIKQVDGVQFLEGIKAVVPKGNRGDGPKWVFGEVGRRRSDDEIDEYVRKVHGVAEDIRRNRFPRRPLAAFNSPCKLCAFNALCAHGDADGLQLPQNVNLPQAIQALAA